MRYSKRDRETAAVYCSMMADFFARPCNHPSEPVPELPLKSQEKANRLAWLSKRFVSDTIGGTSSNRTTAEHYAEAEALIRTGWSP